MSEDGTNLVVPAIPIGTAVKLSVPEYSRDLIELFGYGIVCGVGFQSTSLYVFFPNGPDMGKGKECSAILTWHSYELEIIDCQSDEL